MFLMQLFEQNGLVILPRLTPKIDVPSPSRYHLGLGWGKLTLLYISGLGGIYFWGREYNKMLSTERHGIFEKEIHTLLPSQGV
jgi:hypothetical protein